MKETKIKVTIEKDGQTNIEADGFTDSKCLDATLELEKSLGVVTNRNKKPEANRVTHTGRQIKAK